MTAERQTNRSFTMDGTSVVAGPGETLVDVALRVGISIPTLCHHRALSGYSACRVCMVEVKWGERTKLVAGCVYEPYEGDVVETDNERVRRVRRMVLELLVARCPGVKQIRELARSYGAGPDVFRPGEHDNPHERCILCGRCVRVCNEHVGKHAIAYERRGIRRRITSPFDRASPDCMGCRACAFVCPTGAVHVRDKGGERTVENLQTTLAMAACASCGASFITQRQLAYVEGKLKGLASRADLCPDCRRTTQCDAWETSAQATDQ